jgi:hypothetical protein
MEGGNEPKKIFWLNKRTFRFLRGERFGIGPENELLSLQEKLPFPTVKLWRVGHNRRRFSFLPAVEKPPPLASSHRRL